MDWEKYYTPSKVAKDIVATIPGYFMPGLVIDICAGKGNFLEQAKARWNRCRCVAVDVNSNSFLEASDIEVYQFDALDVNLLQDVVRGHYGSRLVLANPPFGYKTLKDEYSGPYASLFAKAKSTNRMEALMLFANISILRDGDYFGGVIPENFFSSSKFTDFRKEFVSYFDHIKIGSASQAFSESEVRTRSFVGKFRGIDSAKVLPRSEVINNASNYNIIRGVDNSRLVRKGERDEQKKYLEVIHFNSLRMGDVKYRFVEYHKKYSKLIVRSADIVVIRVGRHTGAVFWNPGDMQGKVISDHFVLVRGAYITKRELFQDLIRSRIRGLTTRYITKGDLEICLSMVNAVSVADGPSVLH